MKCSLCGTELTPGSNTCPSCGALNMGFNAPASTPTQAQTVAQSVPTQAPLEVSKEEMEMPSQVEMPKPNPGQSEMNSEGIIEEFVDLDEGPQEVVNATADMAAPSLDVNQENLTQGAQDISNANSVSTYNPEEQEELETLEQQQQPKEESLDIEIPEVKAPEQVDLDATGIQQVVTPQETVGEEHHVKTKFSLKILKQKTLPRKLVIILLIVTLVIGILVGSTMFGTQVYSPGSGSSKTKTQVVKHVADGSNNTTFVGKYDYKIPTEYDYDKSNGGILVFSKDDSFRILIKAIDGNYEHVANAKDSIKRSLENDGTKVNSIVETNINNTNYVVIEANKAPRNRLYAIRHGDKDNLFYVEVITSDDNYNYATLDIADDIINNATYNESRTLTESASHEDVGEMISVTAEAYNKS